MLAMPTTANFSRAESFRVLGNPRDYSVTKPTGAYTCPSDNPRPALSLESKLPG
jgi:hypothetical protein